MATLSFSSIFLLLHLFLLYVNGKMSPRIVGGRPTEVDEYPFAQVQLVENAGGCGGSVVAPDMVLSAAHCAVSSDTSVYIGFHRRRDIKLGMTDERFSVQDVAVHPSYDNWTNSHDVVLIKLNATTSVNSVRINADPRVPGRKANLTLVGMGAENITFSSNGFRDQRFSKVLQEVELEYVNNTHCGTLRNTTPAPEDRLCAGTKTGTSGCSGDSGGPIFIRSDDDDNSSEIVQVGVTSVGQYDCTGSTPAVFHRTSTTFQWIRANICQLSCHPPEYLECYLKDYDTDAPSPVVGIIESSTQTPAMSSTATVNHSTVAKVALFLFSMVEMWSNG